MAPPATSKRRSEPVSRNIRFVEFSGQSKRQRPKRIGGLGDRGASEAAKTRKARACWRCRILNEKTCWGTFDKKDEPFRRHPAIDHASSKDQPCPLLNIACRSHGQLFDIDTSMKDHLQVEHHVGEEFQLQSPVANGDISIEKKILHSALAEGLARHLVLYDFLRKWYVQPRDRCLPIEPVGFQPEGHLWLRFARYTTTAKLLRAIGSQWQSTTMLQINSDPLFKNKTCLNMVIITTALLRSSCQKHVNEVGQCLRSTKAAVDFHVVGRVLNSNLGLLAIYPPSRSVVCDGLVSTWADGEGWARRDEGRGGARKRDDDVGSAAICVGLNGDCVDVCREDAVQVMEILVRFVCASDSRTVGTYYTHKTRNQPLLHKFLVNLVYPLHTHYTKNRGSLDAAGGNSSLDLLVVERVGVDTLGLGNEEDGADGAEDVDTEEDPQDVGNAQAAVGGEVVEEDTGENGTHLADGSGEAVGETADTRGEGLGGDDEGGGVGAEVEEQLGQGEAGKLASGADAVVVASNDTEEQGGEDEATDLDGLASEPLNGRNGQEVTGEVAGDDDDQVTVGTAEELVVGVGAGGEADGGEQRGLVQVGAVEGDVDKEPGGCGADELLQVAPLGEVLDEDLELGGGLGSDGVGLDDGDTAVVLGEDGDVLVSLEGGLLLDGVDGGRRVHEGRVVDSGKLLGLDVLVAVGHGETPVEGDGSRNKDQPNLQAPDGVELTEVVAVKRRLEDAVEDQGNDGGAEGTPALVAENPAQHAAAVGQGGALSDNGSGHRVVTTDTDSHEETEAEEVPGLVHRVEAVVGHGDDEDYADDGNDQFLAVNELATEGVTHDTEGDLADNVTDVGGGIDGTTQQGGVVGGLVAPVLDDPDGGGQVDDEEIVGVDEEADTADEVQLDVALGHEPGLLLAGLIVLLQGIGQRQLFLSLSQLRCWAGKTYEGLKVAILVLASVGLLLPEARHCVERAAQARMTRSLGCIGAKRACVSDKTFFPR
ncbi:hypothetical protein FH972_026185 [Carpinus fangiana]|uniref:Uncharacterized protein n=1 Tax=Carpinus fangiana TaxID=176857 RepID=A0A5N6L485_9ROSI|nr:hypothetical protein FH972_026185 [Carpinus fangiana]